MFNIIVLFITKGDVASISCRYLMAQSLFFVIFLFNFVTLRNYDKMLFKYQICEKRITDVINAFYNNNYTNPTAAT